MIFYFEYFFKGVKAVFIRSKIQKKNHYCLIAISNVGFLL